MGSVPSKVGVFFGKTDKVSEGWYWTDTSIGQKRKAAITGPFETKKKGGRKCAPKLDGSASSKRSAGDERSVLGFHFRGAYAASVFAAVKDARETLGLLGEGEG
jgi:hypothetical protein